MSAGIMGIAMDNERSMPKQLQFESLVPSETPEPGKDRILLFMRHGKVITAASGIAKDWLTGESIPCEICVREACGYYWTSVDTWHYDTYNFRVPTDFTVVAKEHYLDHLRRRANQKK